MTRSDVLDRLEAEYSSYPERATGNEGDDRVADVARSLLAVDRGAIVGAMEEWIARRNHWTMVAIRIATRCGLKELRPSLEAVLADVRTRKVFQPYYEQFIVPALEILT